MFELEKYKNNLDLVDKDNLKNIAVDKDAIYRGDINLLKKQTEEKRNLIPPLAAAVLGLNNTNAPLPVNDSFYNAYTDIDAQELYLSSKPTCYLILGKPGSSGYSIGETLSKKLNCIHLCPKNILTDEIEQKNLTGLCLDFNMRHNISCKPDVILSIMLKKLESPAVKHRGYIISGLPLVTSNRKSYYYFEPMYSEESVLVVHGLLFHVICNLKKKKAKKTKDPYDNTSYSSVSTDELNGEDESEEEEQEKEEAFDEEEQKVELPKHLLDSCSDIILKKKPYFVPTDTMLLQQFLDLINLRMEPDIIIYVTCPDIDLVTKNSHKYFNYTNNLMTFEPFPSEIDSELRWPSKYAISDYIAPYNIPTFNPKYNCRQPINFMAKSVEQICNYRKIIHPFIKKKLNGFDPKSVIRLNACTSLHNMINHIMEKLILLPIKPVLLPEPLYLEELPEDLEEFWKSVEKLNVIHSDSLSFKRYPSPWYNRCPVELTRRQSVVGQPKFAVTFFKHVYLLNSLDAMVSFCRNPRPYLQLKYLEPTCRIIVLGTKCTGKSLVANCLSWIFDTPILCYKTFLEREKVKKNEIFAKTILSEIIATIEDTRFSKWQSTEMERYSKLEAWINYTLENLEAYIPYLAQFLRNNKEPVEISDESPEEEELNEECLQNISYYKKLLSHLPFLDNLQQCENVIKNRTLLATFAPSELVILTPKPGIPVLGDKDVNIAISEYIAANELKQELEPTVDEVMTEMIKLITKIDSKDEESSKSEQMYGQYIIDGFPSDPEYWNYLNDAKLIPDYTVALIENREITPDIVELYANIENSLKNYKERFMLANDPLIKIKIQISGTPDSTEIDIRIILHEIVNNTLNQILSNDVSLPMQSTDNKAIDIITSITETVDKFRESWDNSKLILEENSKYFIEIELDEKTDIQIIEETLLNLRKCYYLNWEDNENEGIDDIDSEEEIAKDAITYNDSRNLCETNVYCPIAFYNHGVLWEGKPELSVTYDNKIHYFSKEECLEIFKRDATKYQFYNNPYKTILPLRICVIGCIGSGKSTVSQMLAKELGLLHINFAEVLNDYLMPKHFKKVGRHYENSFTDVPIDSETVAEFQMDEENQNLISDVMSNETELRLMIYNYLEHGSPIISILMQKLILKLWFENPFSTKGFVLDGYPRLPNDVEDMISCFCIPDLVIELESSTETALERLSPMMFKMWKKQLNEAMIQVKMKLDIELKEWMYVITKNVVCKLIVVEIINNMPITDEEPVTATSTTSVIIDAHPLGSSNVDVHLFNIYNDFIQEFPEPVDLTEWENPDDVRERIDTRIERIYEVDDENLQNLKDVLSEQRIKLVSVDGTKPIQKLFRVALTKLSKLRNRNDSFFEQTYTINTDIAEMLLLEGFYFLSKFKRMCPVYLFENPHTISNNYKFYKRNGTLYTIVHRSYIYFISSKENVRKFRNNPLKFTDSNVIKKFLEYPLRISVVGAPKSGRSTLAKKLAKRYGLFCISRGGAIRSVLKNFRWTELASRIIKKIQLGEIIDNDLIMTAIQILAMDHRTNSYGFVLDGFPEFPNEAKELVNAGLYPTIVFYISSEEDSVIRNSQIEVYYDILKYKPPYSIPFIRHRYFKWKENNYSIKNWISDDYQNLYTLNGNDSQWQGSQYATDIIQNVTNKIHYYLANVETNAAPAGVMGISRETLKHRMSHFKDMCPLCLQKNILKHSGYPVDRKGIVQYKNLFYWSCQDHISLVLKDPHCLLSTEPVHIAEIPTSVKRINMPSVYENGICIVTYADNLPSLKIVPGCSQFAACYRSNTYLFCSDNCFRKFLETPHIYNDITVFKQSKEFPIMSIKKMPNLGYLEQTIGSIITDACCSVNVLRPKYPGLSYSLSGLLYIALYLKTHNNVLDNATLNKYKKVLQTFEARSKLIIDVGLRLRSMNNPFAHYPTCCGLRKLQSPTSFPKNSNFALLSARASNNTSEFDVHEDL